MLCRATISERFDHFKNMVVVAVAMAERFMREEYVTSTDTSPPVNLSYGSLPAMSKIMMLFIFNNQHGQLQKNREKT